MVPMKSWEGGRSTITCWGRVVSVEEKGSRAGQSLRGL